MRYLALACDYDGTLAKDGRVAAATLKALERLRESGRRLILVTGRELENLMSVFGEIGLCDIAVLENGALIYRPGDRSTKLLAEAPPETFVELLRQRDVAPLSTGRAIVATWEPHETTVLEAIHEMGLEMQVIFNKGAVMALPSGVNKGTGLYHALDELELAPHNVVGIGDAENDHAFLACCECAVAVDNALPVLKERADLVTKGARGAGVVELIERLLTNDLIDLELSRHNILIGTSPSGEESWVHPYGSRVLVAGPSGSGKSMCTTALLERLAEHGYQFCLVDPEGDYEGFESTVRLGDSERVPSIDEVLQVLARPNQSVIVNLLGIKLEDRPQFFTTLAPRLVELGLRTGRPHWLVIDEAHHLLPVQRTQASATLPNDFQGVMLVTVHIDRVAPAALEPVTTAIAVGGGADRTLRTFAKAVGEPSPAPVHNHLGPGEVAVWHRVRGSSPVKIKLEPASADHRRHKRKYAKGELMDEECFYFRGPEHKLNLKAQNLVIFAQLAQGIDDETWLHHLRQGDYSRWFERAIKDDQLGADAAEIEQDEDLSAEESRRRILAAIEERYTLPA
ncbi:MAG TPA: HAD-IIB family hydrolase [Chloroflexota bacterium]|nr:HAD-IIB family hydrolase [Chloroflexota bacterium]